MRWPKRLRSKLAYVGVLVALSATVAILVIPRNPPTPGEIAAALVQRIKAGNPVSRSEVEQLFGAPHERAFKGWDAVYLLGDDGSYFPIDGLWLGISQPHGATNIIDAAVFSD